MTDANRLKRQPNGDEIAQIDRLADLFESDFRAGTDPQIEAYLAKSPAGCRQLLLKELLLLDAELRGVESIHHEYGDRFPEIQLLLSHDQSQRLDRWEPAAAFDVEKGGDYELLEELGRGGMGVVHRAFQKPLRRIVAVKLIREDVVASGRELLRFQREAWAAAALRRDGIVQVLDVGRIDGRPFLAMEFMAGANLATRLRETPLTPIEAAGLLRRIAEAVSFAHEQGIVHRDLKPSNILLDRSGDCHVADFGLARRHDEAASLTATAEFLGTPSYAAPEQILGSSSSRATAVDIYSLGAILYEMITGRPPFRGPSIMATLREVLEREPAPPRALSAQVPLDLQTICLKCLEKAPERRYASAQLLADDLGRFLQGEPVHARPLGQLVHAWRWCGRNPVVAGLCAVVVVLLLTLAISSTVAAVRLAQERNVVTQRSHDLEKQQTATRQALYDSHLAEANARRWSGQPGRRFDSLEALKKAAAIHSTSAVRDAILAVCMLNDLRIEHGSTHAHNSDAIDSVTYSPNLEFFAHEFNGDLVIRGVQSGKSLRRISNLNGTPVVTIFSPDGTKVAARLAAEEGDSLQVWEWKTGTSLLAAGVDVVDNAFDFSPDGEVIGVGNHAAELKIIALRDGAERASCSLASRPFRVKFSPHGDAIAVTCNKDRRVQIWKADLAESVAEFEHPHDVYALAWNPSGDRLAVGADFDVHIWDVAAQQRLFSLNGHAAVIHDLAFHPRDDALVSHCWSEGTRWWDLRLRKPTISIRGHFRGFDATGSRLAYCDAAETGLWEVATGEECRGIASADVGTVHDVLFLGDSEHFALATARGTFIWNLRHGRPVNQLTIGPAWGLQWNSDHRQLFAATDDGLKQFDLADDIAAPPTRTAMVDDSHLAHWFALSPLSNSGILLRGDPDIAYHLDMARRGRAPLAYDGVPYYAAISRDGRWCAVSGRHANSYSLFDVSSQLAPTTLNCEDHGDVQFNHDSSRLVTAGRDGYRIWRTGSWTLETIIENPVTDDATMCFSPDGEHLAVTIDRQRIALYDTRSWQRTQTLELTPPPQAVLRIVFSPDGRRLACVSAPEGVIVLELAHLRNHVRKNIAK